MADKAYLAQKPKRGGYSGSKPGQTMAPPAKMPSGFSKNGTKNGASKDNGKG